MNDCVTIFIDDKNLAQDLELIRPKKWYWTVGCFGFNGKNPSLYQFKTFDKFNWRDCFKALDIEIWW